MPHLDLLNIIFRKSSPQFLITALAYSKAIFSQHNQISDGTNSTFSAGFMILVDINYMICKLYILNVQGLLVDFIRSRNYILVLKSASVFL